MAAVKTKRPPFRKANNPVKQPNISTFDLGQFLNNLEEISDKEFENGLLSVKSINFDDYSENQKIEILKIISDLENNIYYGTKKELTSNKGNKMSKNLNGWHTNAEGIQKHYINGEMQSLGLDPAEIRPNGTQLWFNKGKLHREDGLPAMLGVNGTKKFAVNGKYHRLGGLPAITWSKGMYREEYWTNGQIQKALKKDGTWEHYAPGCSDREEAILHRTDGPAILYPNGNTEYFIDGQFYPDEKSWLAGLNTYSKTKSNIANKVLQEELIEELEGKQERKMTKKMPVTDMLKADAVNAAYRVAGNQASKAVKAAIVQVMQKQGADGGKIQALSEFLDTEIGVALISGILGMTLQYVPHFGADPRMQRLSEEMRVGAMTTVGNVVIGEAMEHLLPVITNVLKALPEETTSNVRVEGKKVKSLAEAAMEQEEEEMDTEVPKTAKA